MEESIFQPLESYFSKYSNIMNEGNEDDTFYIQECKYIRYDNEEDEQSYYIKAKCVYWYPYLNHIRSDKGNTKIIDGLQYLYYWIYRDYPNDGLKKENMKEIYRKLINKYNGTSFGQVGSNRPLPKNITGKEWEELIDICNMNTELNYIKKKLSESSEIQGSCAYLKEFVDKCIDHATKCKSNTSPNVCKIFENIANQINTIILENGCNESNHQISPSTHSQNEPRNLSSTINSRTIIISSVLILLLPMLIYILYKFTPYNSYLNRQMRGLINSWNNINKKWNIWDRSGIYNGASRSGRYNLPHHSEYFYN